jgi:hypothetical protein
LLDDFILTDSERTTTPQTSNKRLRLTMDFAHWEFIGMVFGIALTLLAMSGWAVHRYLRHGIGFVGVLLTGSCIVLLSVFSGARLRSPVSFRWPVVLPTEKISATKSFESTQIAQTVTPTPVRSPRLPDDSAEMEALQTENARLKTENARLRKFRPPRVVAVSPKPLAGPSIAQPIVTSSKLSADDCDALLGAQKLVDSVDTSRMALIKGVAEGRVKTDEQATQIGIQAAGIKITDDQAIANLNSLQERLCASKADN